MTDILLATLNARYIHSAFGLRYLYANLGALQSRGEIFEFDISHRPTDVVERILARNPKIVGFGVYIWNARQIQEVLEILRAVAPEVTIVLGGPEVSHDAGTHPLYAFCDHIIAGEADHAFRELCIQILNGSATTLPKLLQADLPEVETLAFPYQYYTEKDIAHRVVYVEASRGCPFRCEFCLSSLDIPVRQFPLEAFLGEMQLLIDRGVTQFKFIDRTFNLNTKVSIAILEFFLERYRPGHFFHFEMVPDRLPDALRDVIEQFPKGTLQFEVGIQTFNPEVAALISRKQNYEKLHDNLQFLRTKTGVHIHADLIVGLPGETLESFAKGFNTLVTLDPQEIQVGILKRLRGTPIVRHDAAWKMVYAPNPPYELLSNTLLDFRTMQALGRFAKYWDLVSNSGHFQQTKKLLWKDADPYSGFMQWSAWLHEKTGVRHGFAVKALEKYLKEYLTTVKNIALEEVLSMLLHDRARFQEGGRDELSLPERQARHAR